VSRQAAALRQYLTRLGLAMVPQRQRVQGKLVDKARLRGLVLHGDPRILIARRTEAKTDLFLGVVIDCSGSMAIDKNIEKAKLFGALLAEASRGLRGIDLRVWGFTDRRIYDCGDATRPAVHDLFAGEGNNDAAALYHAAQVGRASRRRAKLLVMISDGAPTECTVEALRGLVKRLTARQGFLCAQVGVRPLEHITFPHHILLQDGNVDASVKRFGAVVMGLVRQALG
jgi:cobalamin biosynthesis protein CobT